MPVKISGLPAGTALTGTEKIPAVQSGVTVYSLVSQIGTYVRGLFTTTPATIAEGGTGAATAAGARTNLGATTIGASIFTAATAAAERALITPLTTKGDLWGFSSIDAPISVGANGTILMARSAAILGMAYVSALNSSIYGFTYTTDAVQGITIAAGGAMDSTGAYWITGASLIKKADTAWAVGTNQGSLDTGAIGNNDYYIWGIARSDTGVVDYLTSLSSTAPTMPANYDFKRLIGWFKRAGGTITAFHTYEIEGGGLELIWDAPTLDIGLANTLTTIRRTDLIKVPQNFSVEAHINALAFDASVAGNAWICCPDQTDAAPSTTVAPLCNLSWTTTFGQGQFLKIRTSASGLIAARSTVATTDLYNVSTMGFRWPRRN